MDKQQFADRVMEQKQRLYRTAYLYLGSEASALEAVDEAVYKALKSLKSLREPLYFDTWLMRILINECKKELRRMKRSCPLEYIPEDRSEELDYDALVLRDAIARLPQELRAVVILRFFTGYTLAQTAESLQIPQGTTVTRQRRALALLKLELSEEE